MSETTTDAPYVKREPGDLLTAEDWNTLQHKVYDDIRSTSQAAADAVTHVAGADDADRLEGKDLDALTDEITKRVLDEVRGRSGYQQLFKILRAGEITVLEHGLGTAPLVDLYKLEYFAVVDREDDETRLAYATFYLHNSEEKRVRVTDESGKRISVNIQAADGPERGIPFADMLARYDVPYTESTTLDDLETEFWKAFYKDPNDQFGDDQYSHSPWFERCCKEQQTVKQLKANGDWNDIVFQFRPHRTENFAGVSDANQGGTVAFPKPANVHVSHLDNNRTALWFTGKAVHDVPPKEGLGFDAGGNDDESAARDYIGAQEFDGELKLMILLKV